jgi:hypothetical protein
MGYFDPREIDLQEQVRMLGKEVASLRKAAAKRSNNFYEQANELYGQASGTASEYYADIIDAIRAAMPGIRRRARAAETTALQNPAIVAAVGLVVLGLAASLLFRRRSEVVPSRAQVAERPRPARASSAPARTSSRAAPRKRPSRAASTGGANAARSDGAKTSRSDVANTPRADNTDTARDDAANGARAESEK